ncbi:MAG: VWA domain-containing protein [Burkholderiales bacterium]|nr:VWA domain-containing protein [Burkholderiales bacterium]
MKTPLTGQFTPRRALMLATACLVLAAWGPTVTLPLARFHGIIVLDVTQSMNVEDYSADERPQSRLDAAKAALHEALQALPCGSRVGWGVFTEYRTLVLLAPLETCAHFRELGSTLDSIDGRLSWAGRSEIAKGIFWALRQADVMPHRPSIVFVTDGHEAPPINPRHRPHYDGKPGTIAGLIVGTGGLQPMPIPKFDPAGRRLGYWRADEVQQQDTYSMGRATSVGQEKLVETEEETGTADWATSGNEHMSALRERYLQVLAQELKLDYLRLDGGNAGARSLSRALGRSALAQRVPTKVSLGGPLAAIALALLAWTFRPAFRAARYRGTASPRSPGTAKP